MTKRRSAVLAAVGIVLALAQPQAGSPPRSVAVGSEAQSRRDSQPNVRPSFESTATAILVDVVVRDKHGRPVTDLRADDFALYEDDVRQTLGSFTRVSRGGGIGVSIAVKDPSTTIVLPPSSTADPEPPAARDPYPAYTALVFDALSPDAVSLCQKAAAQYLPLSGNTEARLGVFATEPTLTALQPYTDDPALVRRAMRRILPTNTVLKELRQERIDALRERRTQIESSASNANATTASGLPDPQASTNIGQLEMEQRLVRSQLQMVQAFETLDRDHRGYGTTAALFAVIQSLVENPGRKTIVFFSEGLPASPAMQSQLQTLIEAANRFNVSIYAIDATGLRAVSGTHDTRKEIEEAGTQRMRQIGFPQEGADEPLMRVVERAEDLLRFDSQGGLAQLAQDTGGILIRDTNNLRQAFRRVDEDMKFHYLLTYAPSNQAFDGKFRTIAVKVARPSVDVFARKGYRALRSAPTVPVLDYEAPALAALEARQLPNAFAFGAAALSFPEPRQPGLSPVVVRIGTDALTYTRDATTDSYAGDATVLVRFKDATAKVIHTVSQQYHLTGRLHELEAARRGEILFYRQPDLAPGVYNVEAVVYDAGSNRASAKAMTIEIPAPTNDRVRLSSVLLVRKAERLTPQERSADNPLQVGDLLLYPNAGEPVSRGRDHDLTFYYVVYPRKAAGRAPDATVELRRDGRTIAQVPVSLGAADAAGRIQQLSRLPLQSLAAGTYELHVSVRDGRHAVARSTFFTVAE